MSRRSETDGRYKCKRSYQRKALERDHRPKSTSRSDKNHSSEIGRKNIYKRVGNIFKRSF